MLMKSGDSFWVTTSEFIDLLKGAWIGDRVSDSNKWYEFPCFEKKKTILQQIINYFFHILGKGSVNVRMCVWAILTDLMCSFIV